MKNVFVLTLLTLVAAAHAANPSDGNNGNDKPVGNSGSPSATSASGPSTSSAGAAAVAGAAAGAIAGSASTSGASASGTGGAGGRGGDGGYSTSSASGSNSNDDETNTYVLPAPVLLPSMAAVPCASAMIKNDAFSIGWNFISVGKGQTDTTDCTLITLRNSKVEACQYASAKQIEDMLIAKYLPAFVPSAGTMRDMSTEECAAAKK